MSEVETSFENQLAEFKPFEAKLMQFKERYDDVIYDLSDPKQEKQARSDQYAIGTVVGKLDRKHKELKAPLSEKVRLLDGKRKEIKDELRGVQSKIKIQIERHEEKIAEHKAFLESKVEAISELADLDECGHLTSAELKARLDKASGVAIDASFEHLQNEAISEKKRVVGVLEAEFERVALAEREAERLARLKKEAEEREAKEREERLKKEASEAARIEAERKAAQEIARIEAEKQQAIIDAEKAKKKAEQDAIAAKEAAELKAKQAVILERQRAEKLAAEQEAAKKAEQEALAKQKAEKGHVERVLSEIEHSFKVNGFNAKKSKLITELIRDNKIANVQINW